MKVRCIKEIEEGYIKRACTVGNTYEVVEKGVGDYLLIDDNNERWWYVREYFEEVGKVKEGMYYWVKCTEKDDFEPAMAVDYYENGSLYFKFINGSIKEVKYAFATEPLEYKK